MEHGKQNQLCLTEEQAIRLTRIGVWLEKMYGNARDIEWAVHEVLNIYIFLLFVFSGILCDQNVCLVVIPFCYF